MGGLVFELTHRGRSRRVTVHAPSVVLGRSKDCDLIVDLPSIAPRHLIVQVDPPFVRAKTLDGTARAIGKDGPLTGQWRNLRPGVLLTIPCNEHSLVIRIARAVGEKPRVVVAPGCDVTPEPSDFGVRFVTESPLDGEQEGWLRKDEPGNEPIGAGTSQATSTRSGAHRLKKTLVTTCLVMAVLIAGAVVFKVQRRSAIESQRRADYEALSTAVSRAEDLVRHKNYVAAKAELEHGRNLAVKWPTLDGKVREIDFLMSRPAIRLGATGYIEIESQWLPGETARAWTDARKRDDPTIDSLLERATLDLAAGRWEDCRIASNDALALMDSHPVKSHPRRDRAQILLTRAGNEILRAEMTAKGFVLYEDKWITPGDMFKIQQTAKGLVEYSGAWVTPDQAFAAQQKDKGLVLFRGRWMTEDESMAAKGFVRFEGKWLSPADKTTALATRAAAEEKRRREAAEEAQRRAEMAAQRERQRAVVEANKEAAYLSSQEFVKNELKAPLTAKFPPLGDPKVTVVYVDGWYLVGATVDAQNAFGVMLRKRYVCKLRPIAGTDRWEQQTTGFVD